MSKNRKIFLGVIVIMIIGTFVFFVGKVIQDRYFSSSQENQNQTETGSENKATNPENTSENKSLEEEPDNPGEFLNPEDQKEDQEEEKELEEDQKEPTLKEKLIDITQKDCDNKCDNFKKNPADQKYCREVCGLSEVQKRSSEEECEDKEDLELDYCLRDLGIAKKDFSICEKIEDAGIEKMCRDRITEILIDGSQAE